MYEKRIVRQVGYLQESNRDARPKNIKNKCFCFIYGLNAYRAGNTLHLGCTRSNLLMVYKVKVHTKHSKQCEYHVEFLNVKTGGIRNNRWAVEG